MPDARARLHFDYIDPGSWLMERRVSRALEGSGLGLRRVPFEVRPPWASPLDAADPGWIAYWVDLAPALEAEGLDARRPDRVPWTRKAHELCLHAEAELDDVAEVDALHRELFDALLARGADIGRIDVLVPLAVARGLDRTTTKAVLDVDKYAADVDSLRERAEQEGVRGVPTLLHGGRALEGLHDEDAIRAFLGLGRPTH